MRLLKTSLLNGIAVLVKMLTLLGINKVLAIYVGPAGYAAVGQFQNAVQMITAIASGAINTGVTKYTAEYYENETRQRQVWCTAGTISLVGSLVASILIATFNKSLALWFLKDPNYGGVFLWFAGTLVLFTFNTLLLAILNGKKEINHYVVANISGSVFALVVTSIMSFKLGLYGALVALAVYQSISFFITLLICYKTTWFRFQYLIGRVDRKIAINLSKYTAMALTSAICVPLSHVLIRDYLTNKLGLEAAGYWEAMWRLSAAYLLLITTTFSVYYLPRLSELKNTVQLKIEIIQIYRFALPLALTAGVSIYFLRDIIIALLFSKDFIPMRELFAWQMLGDTLKIGGWVLAYLMLSKAMYKTFIVSEIMFAILFVLSTYFLVGNYGLKGVSMAHAVNYGLYWSFVYYAIWKRLD